MTLSNSSCHRTLRVKSSKFQDRKYKNIYRTNKKLYFKLPSWITEVKVIIYIPLAHEDLLLLASIHKPQYHPPRPF